MAETIPQSRIEDILDGEPVPKPQSRIERLLIEGGGGTGNIACVDMDINESYVLSAVLKKKDGTDMGEPSSVDLPLEEMIVSGYYDDNTKKVVLTLRNGNAIQFSVADLVSGLQSEITTTNKLSSDLVDDTNKTNLFVTSTEKTTWNGKQNALSFDSVPTDGSTNPVESNGIYDALAGKADKSTTYTKDETIILLTYKQNALTSAQLAAANSGITSAKVGQYDDIYAVMNYDALNHNGIFRGKDLTNVYTIAEMYDMIHAGTFDDLFLGDYFTKSITTDIMTRFTGEAFESGTTYYEMGGGTDVTARTWTETEDTTPQSGKTYATKQTVTENVTTMFAAFDYYYNTGDTVLTTHHAALIPREYGFATMAIMNSTNSTIGAYFNSDMHQIVLPCYAKSIKTMLNNHLISHRALLSNAVNASTPSNAGLGFTGASSGWEWTTVELQLMTEQQVFGARMWTSSAYDVGIDYRKFPIFDFINPAQYRRANSWLRSVVSSTSFAYCTGTGYAFNGGAGGAGYVRPVILFG